MKWKQLIEKVCQSQGNDSELLVDAFGTQRQFSLAVPSHYLRLILASHHKHVKSRLELCSCESELAGCGKLSHCPSVLCELGHSIT